MKKMFFRKERTRLSRFTPAFAFTNMFMLPFSIHSDTMTNRFSVIVTPTSGKMFG